MASRQRPKEAADAVRSAVDRTVHATVGGASVTRERAQDLVDEVAQAATRVREVIDDLRLATGEDLRAVHDDLRALERRVAALERTIAEHGAGAPARKASGAKASRPARKQSRAATPKPARKAQAAKGRAAAAKPSRMARSAPQGNRSGR